MTEKDAERVLMALGGEAGAFRDKAVVDRLIKDILKEVGIDIINRTSELLITR